jgi:hypothetical protein
MATIWNDIELTWGGEVYTIRPTLDFINRIEQGEGRSITQLFTRIAAQDLPSGIACAVIADTLNYAGAKVTADEIFEHTGGLGVVLFSMAATIVLGCMPKSKQQPQEAAPAKKKAVRRKS